MIHFLLIAGRQKDILFIGVFVIVLVMMILPLPVLLMDVFITMNISAAIIIILLSMRLHNAAQFSTFPAILLITTLFRLAISIATTRLILIEGNAGNIVETFGQMVVGGNLVVGLIIFLIITVVQFLVITKGADRVAEVGARFTLDGMPGKQMSVDADVRAGNIDQLDARIARQELEKEAKLFGSMDGAMKFVKGDAMAGLIITAINLLGGIAIGMLQRDMDFASATQLYALMTIGDGLVSQIPALLISVAAGIIVTRVKGVEDIELGTEVGNQIFSDSYTIIIASIFIALFGFIPGFPTLAFLFVGLILIGRVYWNHRVRTKEIIHADKDWKARYELQEKIHNEIEMRTGTKESVKLILPSHVQTYDVSLFCQMFDGIMHGINNEFGVDASYWKFQISENNTDEYEIHINQEILAREAFKSDMYFVKANVSYLETLDIPVETAFGHREGVFVNEKSIPTLVNAGIEYWGPLEQLFMHLKQTLAENLDYLSGSQNTSDIVKKIQRNNPILVENIKEVQTNSQIGSIFRMLLQERIPITSKIQILETILQSTQIKNDTNYILKKVRIAIGDFITKRFAPKGFLPVIIIAPTLEAFIREGLRETDEGNFLIIEPSISGHIAKQASDIANGSFKRGVNPAFITQVDTRRTLFNILNEYAIYVPVVAYQEITPETVIYPVGYLSIENEIN